jgi:hypothetical protein
MRRRFIPAIASAIALVAGCGTTIRTTVVNRAPHRLYPHAPDDVEVFTSGPPQGRRYVDYAYLEAEQETRWSAHDTPQFIGELRAQAAAMGCDAIVVGGTTNATSYEPFGDTTANIKGLVATCLVYDEPAPPPIAATP